VLKARAAKEWERREKARKDAAEAKTDATAPPSD
jgi:hypothetical protein